MLHRFLIWPLFAKQCILATLPISNMLFPGTLTGLSDLVVPVLYNFLPQHKIANFVGLLHQCISAILGFLHWTSQHTILSLFQT